MPNLYAEYRKKKRSEELKIINNKIKSCKRQNNNIKSCKRKIIKYNYNTTPDYYRESSKHSIKNLIYEHQNALPFDIRYGAKRQCEPLIPNCKMNYYIPLRNICSKQEYIIHEFRKCYRNLKKSNIKQSIIFNDLSRTLLSMDETNIKLFVSYSKIYGLYLYVNVPDVVLSSEKKDPDIILLKKMEELRKFNLELEEQKNRLLAYIKNIQGGLHFIGKGEAEPISCNRLAFMTI
jgi:hypothetical protein